MLTYNEYGIVIEIINWTGQEVPSVNFVQNLFKAAKFIGCTKLQYEDGKDETYHFYKADGSHLTINVGHDNSRILSL